MNRVTLRRGKLLGSALCILAASNTQAETINLPHQDPGSYGTSFDFLSDDRLLAYTGFNIHKQSTTTSSVFNQIGQLPAEFLGGSSPGFIQTGPVPTFYILGSGAGGSKYPDPPYNGTIFILPASGGTATPIANIPFHYDMTFWTPVEILVNRGEGTFADSDVEYLSLVTRETKLVIKDIPGASSGIGKDQAGNIYTGIGYDPNAVRTGEIRRFSFNDVNEAIRTGVPLDYETDGVFVTQALSASGVHFDQEGHLWVAGGALSGGGQQGFIAEIDPQTGAFLRRIDPSDGDPDSGPTNFFSIAINHQADACTIAAVDYFDANKTVHKIDACP